MAEPARAAGSQRDLLYLEAIAYHPVEVLLNDVFMARLDGTADNAGRGYLPAAQLVRRGSNRLTVRLLQPFFPPPPPEPGEFQKVWVRARVAAYADGEHFFEDQGQNLVDLVWSPPTPGATRELAFQSPLGPAQWAWERCDPLDVGPLTVRDALGFVETLQTAYRAGDPAPILDASAPKIADLAIAFPNHTPATLQSAIATSVSDWRPGPSPAPVQFAPRLCGDGRMFDCLASDGHPYVRRVNEGGDPTYLRLMIGRMSGRWHVIR